MPDAGDHARFEVYEGGVLVVSPAPGVGHQRASYRLHRALAQAALTAGADAEVLEAVNLALPGGKLLSRTSWSWRPEQSVRRPPGFLARGSVRDCPVLVDSGGGWIRRRVRPD
jgi:hypothetical protein